MNSLLAVGCGLWVRSLPGWPGWPREVGRDVGSGFSGGSFEGPGVFVQRSADVPGAVCEGPIQREPTQQCFLFPFHSKFLRGARGVADVRSIAGGQLAWAVLGSARGCPLTADQHSGSCELTPSAGRCHRCKSPSCINPLLMDGQAGVKPRQGRR